MGGIHNGLKKYDKAIDYCQKAIDISPKHAEAYYFMGNAYYGLGDTKQAVSYYQKAARLNQDDAQEWLEKKGYSW
jgi:tetratricopeptide (TPR) repeat protein